MTKSSVEQLKSGRRTGQSLDRICSLSRDHNAKYVRRQMAGPDLPVCNLNRDRQFLPMWTSGNRHVDPLWFQGVGIVIRMNRADFTDDAAIGQQRRDLTADGHRCHIANQLTVGQAFGQRVTTIQHGQWTERI
jgi:hypothetical protein